MPDKRIGVAAARSDAVTVIELFELTLNDGSVLRFTPSHPVRSALAGRNIWRSPSVPKAFVGRRMGHRRARNLRLQITTGFLIVSWVILI